jgi:hypothetical protein
LPQTVSGDGVKAEYRDGVLRVTLPKREETKARRIEIAGEETSKGKTIETKADVTASGDKTKAAGGV